MNIEPVLIGIRERGMGDALRGFSGKYSVRENGCWIWTSAATKDGYGTFRRRQKRVNDSAHRASWKIFFGDIPDGMHVCHKCDVKLCVNPDHLFIGTRSENMQDCVRKGRARRNPIVGSNSHLAKITEDDVRAIRASSETNTQLAVKYGLTHSNICHIRRGNTWKHVK